MKKQETVSYQFEGCHGSSFSGNISFGSDVGFRFLNSQGITVNGNKHFSDKVMNQYYETMRIVHAYHNEIAEKLGDKQHQEIVELLQSIVNDQSKSTVDYMEKFISLGANTLTIWPAIKQLLSMLTAQ